MWAIRDKVLLNCISFHKSWSPLAIGIKRKECEAMRRGNGCEHRWKRKWEESKEAGEKDDDMQERRREE